MTVPPLPRPGSTGRFLETYTQGLTAAELERVGDDYLLATARAQRFAGGYFDQAAQLWSRDGVLLATTNQIVYYKDSR